MIYKRPLSSPLRKGKIVAIWLFFIFSQSNDGLLYPPLPCKRDKSLTDSSNSCRSALVGARPQPRSNLGTSDFGNSLGHPVMASSKCQVSHQDVAGGRSQVTMNLDHIYIYIYICITCASIVETCTVWICTGVSENGDTVDTHWGTYDTLSLGLGIII